MSKFNFEHAAEARELLVAQPEAKFDMGSYFVSVGDDRWWAGSIKTAQLRWEAHACNTVVCFAGLIQMHKAVTIGEQAMGAFDFACDWLGLTSDEGWELFMPENYSGGLARPVTKEMVLNRFDSLVELKGTQAQ